MAKFDPMDMRMSAEQQQAFLSEPRYAILAVPREGKAPLVMPVWYSYDPGGDVVFTCEESGERAAHLAVGTPVTLNVQDAPERSDEHPWYENAFTASYVSVEGVVSSVDAPGGQAALFGMQPKRWLSRDYKKLSGG